jgi:hypothetical protein
MNLSTVKNPGRLPFWQAPRVSSASALTRDTDALDFQAIVEADELVPAHRSVAERSLLLGSSDPRPACNPGHHVGATSGLLSPFFVAPLHQQTFD